MALSFAGVRLAVLPDDYASFLEQYHSLTDFVETDLWGYSGSNLDHLPLPSRPNKEVSSVGRLVWPTGMTRCAYAHYLIDCTTDVGLDEIRTNLGVGVAGPATLAISDSKQSTSISPAMYMVAARPLSQIENNVQGFLITLVDKRYFLRTLTGSVTSTPTSWSSLLASLASQLGITLTVDTIDADYAAPTDRWVFHQKPLAPILDAVCNVIGHRLVANLDGTFKTVSYATASAASVLLTDALTKTAGGLCEQQDLIRPVPASVKTVFRNSNSTTPHTVTVTLASLALAEYGAATGVSGQTEVVYAELVYTGANAAACTAYATQAATDYYKWALLDLDVTYPGIAEWAPTGAEERVEWIYEVDRKLTRVMRPPFQTLKQGGFETGPQSSGSNSSTPSPWIAGLGTSDCIELSVVSAVGACSDVPVNQIVYLVWDAGDSRWESASNFTYDGGTGAVNFTRVAPVPTITIGGVDGYFLTRKDATIQYEFGGSTLCGATPVNCTNTFVVSLRCSGCPASNSYTTSPTQLTVGPAQTDTLQLPVYQVDNGDPLNFVQFTIDNEGTTGGISQLTLDLIAPDGTIYQLTVEPPDVTSTYGSFVLDPSAPTALSALVVDNPDPALGVYQGVVDFSAYTGPKNGVWQLVVDNGGDAPVTVTQFTLTFGSPVTALTIDATATPPSGSPPLNTSLSWVIGGTGTPVFVWVDWDDGSDPEYFEVDATPQLHTYSSAGSYGAIVRVYDVNGDYAEDTVTIVLADGSTCANAIPITLSQIVSNTSPAGIGWEVWYSLGVLPAGTYTLDTSVLDAHIQVYVVEGDPGCAGSFFFNAGGASTGTFSFDSPGINGREDFWVIVAPSDATGGPANYEFEVY